jgi:hypothetical protein
MTIHATPPLLDTSEAWRGPIRWELLRIEEDLFAILVSNEVIGFVQRAGHIFVALSGSREARAVEVGQTLGFDEAVRLVQESN